MAQQHPPRRTESHVWAIEQVVAVAGSAARFGAGESAAIPSRWSRTGTGERAVWGRYHGSAAEPYDVAVDHVTVTDRCTCPSRSRPCKHVVALLILWVRGHVPDGAEPAAVAGWVDRERRLGPDRGAGTTSPAPAAAGPAGLDVDDVPPAPEPTSPDPADAARDERIERLRSGLVELDRWLEDRVRTGLADPAVARYATWDELARRLTDSRAGALANRVRRLAGRVGAESGWQEHVLAEIGVLHLLAQAGQRVGRLPNGLADGVAVACGWQVRRADVEASPPVTDRWLVAGRSDTREDLVEVRRVWLHGIESGSWATILSFAAYRQSLDDSLVPGTVIAGDLHRYPGSVHRALVGEVTGVERAATPVHDAAVAAAATIHGACRLVGTTLAAEPWLERVPAIVTAAITRGDGEWLLTDDAGSLAIAPEAARSDSVATLLAASGGRPVTSTVEWTASGLVPLTVFLDDRAIDIGPRADPSFVSAA